MVGGGGLRRLIQNAYYPHNATEHPIMVEGLKRVTQNAHSPHNAIEHTLLWGD